MIFYEEADMAEAKLKLPNGTEIAITGTPEEVAKLIALYNGADSPSRASGQRSKPNAGSDESSASPKDINLTSIINTINDCEEAETIEKRVLDNPDVVNRVLLCLYINEKYFGSKPPMTTGEISTVLQQLGVPVSTANVSSTISRKAKNYVMYDGVRKKGTVTRYAINRRGTQYFENLIGGSSNESAAVSVSAPKVSSSKKTAAKKVKKGPTSDSTSKDKKSEGVYKPKYNKQLNLLGLSDFVGALQLNNNTEFLIAFYKFLEEKTELETVNGDDIFTCFSEMKSKVKMPGSFMNTLRNAQNREHVITYDRGFVNLGLTPKGENLFNHEIVKREKGEG